MKTVTSGSHPEGVLRGKRGFGAAENEIYCRRKHQSLMITDVIVMPIGAS
jgi:hypothetical protein